MSTAAITASGATTLLVVKPVIATDSEPGTNGVLVKLAPRQEPAGGAPAAQGTSQRTRSAAPRRRKGTSAVAALEPQPAEQEMVEMLSSKVAQAVLEVISGIRSVQQLARWLNTMCLSALTTRARLHAEAYKAQTRRQSRDGGSENVRTLHHQPIVRSVHASFVSPGIYETVVVMADKTRFRAVAMRFEQERGLWRVTALTIG